MTSKHEQAIAKDLEQWAHTRLMQWVSDVVMRFEIAGLPASQASSILAAELLGLTGKAIGIGSTMPAKDAGDMLTFLIDRERGKKARKRSK